MTNDWEEEFDSEFNGIYYGKDDDNIPNYPPEGFKEDVKDFIHQHFIPKDELMRMLEEMKKSTGPDPHIAHLFKDYNQALADLKSRLTEGKKDPIHAHMETCPECKPKDNFKYGVC